MAYANATKRIATNALGYALMFSALGSAAHAVSMAAPEIDPGSMASALTLLASGAFVVGRKARKS
jgi:hypothetical protein